MKLTLLMTINAVLLVGLGIAFALYGPLMMAFFSVPDKLDNALSYWQVAAFARMFGAALFSFGLLVWAVRGAIDQLSPTAQRSLLSALMLANLLGAFVAATQQSSVWQTPAGWIATGFFAVFSLAYGYFTFARPKSEPPHELEIS